MADQPDFTSETTPSLQQLIDYLVEQFHDPEKVKRWETALTNAGAKSGAIVTGLATATLDPLLELLGKFLFSLEGHVETIAGPPLARLAGHLIGQDVPIAELRRSASSSGDSIVGSAVAKLALDALRPPAGDVQPGDDRATKFLSVLGQLVVNGWFEATAFELITTIFPDMDGFESVAELPHELIDALGLGRLARVALRPLAQIGVATPLEWQLNKDHRPTLLSEASVVRQGFRGKWDWADVQEVLARKGYSDAAISALINEQQKFLATDDLALMVWLELLGLAEATQTLVDQGYDPQTASKHFNVQKIKREDTIHRELATDAITAYVDRRISDAQLADTLAVSITGAHERDLLTTVAQGKRALNSKLLSAPQVADCVKVGILGFADYRDALTREGYSDADGAALELLLRHTIDTKKSIADLKQQQADERAAAAKAKADAAAAKEAAAAARAALARRGSIADNKAAVVRGIETIAQYRDLLAQHYDADTVNTMVQLAEQARQDYLDKQAKADAAAKKAADKGLNVNQLEAAVLAGVLTPDVFKARVVATGLDPTDADVLVATMSQKLADRQAAEKKRADAAAKAATKHASLATWEALVRAGHRTLADFDAFLVSIGEDDASRAAIEDLLSTKIAADQTVAALKAANAAKKDSKGLTLAQMTRATTLGNATIDAFTAWLTQNGFTTDAVSVLVANERDAVAKAAAVQARRTAATRRPGSPTLTLATYAKAARLGLITIDAYRAKLSAAGYSADDIELDVDELLVEIADSQAKKAAGGQDAATLVGDISSTLAQAQILRAALDAGLKAKQLSSAQLEQAVKDGKLTIAAYVDQAEQVGLDPADAELLGSLLHAAVTPATTPATAPAPKATRAKTAKTPKAAP